MPQNAVIVYMSCTRDLPLLFRSLVLLCKNFSRVNDYPIVIFHDDISKTDMSQLFVALHREVGFIPSIKFEILEFKMPDGVSTDPSMYTVPLSQFWMGYRHMCRFHAGQIYRDERLLRYDWYWRLDSDSYMLSPIPYDPFERMAQSGYEYAYMCDEDKDVRECAVGMWDSTKEFMQKHGISSPSLESRLVNGEWDLSNFYDNFEIAKFSFFRSERYMAYFDHMDATKNFYYRRWGDHNMHWLGVRMLMDDSKVWAVKDMAYQHNNWVKNLNVFPDRQIPDDILRYIDGDETRGRRGRLIYAMNRYRSTGIDGCNWGD